MRKNTIILFAVAFCLITATTVFAISSLVANNDKTTSNTSKDNFVSEEIAMDFVSETITEGKEQITESDYAELEGYLYFVEKYNPAEEELKIVNALISDGISIDTIIEVFDFYRTTNEKPEMISKLVAYEGKLQGNHWVENAFNAITDNKYGVLDYESYMEYLDNGSTIEEISAANILSRQGVYTIQEVLQKRENDILWSDIINDVYSETEGKVFETPMTGKNDNGIKLLELKMTSDMYNVEIEALEKMDEAELKEFKVENEQKQKENVRVKLKSVGVEIAPDNIVEK